MILWYNNIARWFSFPYDDPLILLFNFIYFYFRIVYIPHNNSRIITLFKIRFCVLHVIFIVFYSILLHLFVLWQTIIQRSCTIVILSNNYYLTPELIYFHFFLSADCGSHFYRFITRFRHKNIIRYIYDSFIL